LSPEAFGSVVLQQERVVSRRTLGNLLKYALALSLLVYVVWANWGTPGSNGLGDVWQRHVVEGVPVHGWYFLAAAVIFTAAALITMLRWYLLVRAQDLPFTLGRGALGLGLVGCFFNAFLPGSVGGDIYKAAALARHQSRRTVAVATVVMDRVIALWGLFWFVALLGSVFWLTGALDGPAGDRCKGIVAVAAAVVAVSVVVWLLLGLLPPRRAERFARRLEHIPRVGGSAAEFWRAVWMYRCRQGSVYLTLALSWVGHVGFVFTFYFCARTLWDGKTAIPSLTQHFLLVPIGLVVQAVVPFPGGMGIGELGFGALYSLLGGTRSAGVLGSLVQRVIAWGLGLVGAVVYLSGVAAPRAAVPPPAGDEPEADAEPLAAAG
jgi:uncharacterized protein (TIRG00374 family)